MEILENIETKETNEIEMPKQRVNPFCVISKATFGEYNVRDIQTNGSWSSNPYDDYAVVPDDMVQGVMETKGFCDIELNEDGTELASYTPLEIPVIPQAEPEPTKEEKKIAELESEIATLSGLCADLLYKQSLAEME